MTDEAFGLYRALMDAGATFTRERMDCQRREHSRDGCMSFAKDIAYAPSFFCVSPLRPKISSLPWCRRKGRHKARAGQKRQEAKLQVGILRAMWEEPFCERDFAI